MSCQPLTKAAAPDLGDSHQGHTLSGDPIVVPSSGSSRLGPDLAEAAGPHVVDETQDSQPRGLPTQPEFVMGDLHWPSQSSALRLSCERRRSDRTFGHCPRRR